MHGGMTGENQSCLMHIMEKQAQSWCFNILPSTHKHLHEFIYFHIFQQIIIEPSNILAVKRYTAMEDNTDSIP